MNDISRYFFLVWFHLCFNEKKIFLKTILASLFFIGKEPGRSGRPGCDSKVRSKLGKV